MVFDMARQRRNHSKEFKAEVVQLVLAGDRDVESLRDLYRIIVEEGNSYPHERFPDHHDFMDYWFRGKSTVAAYAQDRVDTAPMAGAFYLKPNWPGRARQVANAGSVGGGG